MKCVLKYSGAKNKIAPWICNYIAVPESDFQFIKWEDEEPFDIEKFDLYTIIDKYLKEYEK